MKRRKESGREELQKRQLSRQRQSSTWEESDGKSEETSGRLTRRDTNTTFVKSLPQYCAASDWARGCKMLGNRGSNRSFFRRHKSAHGGSISLTDPSSWRRKCPRQPSKCSSRRQESPARKQPADGRVAVGCMWASYTGRTQRGCADAAAVLKPSFGGTDAFRSESDRRATLIHLRECTM